MATGYWLHELLGFTNRARKLTLGEQGTIWIELWLPCRVVNWEDRNHLVNKSSYHTAGTIAAAIKDSTQPQPQECDIICYNN